MSLNKSERRERGFALAITIWMIAVLGLAVATVNQWSFNATSQAIRFADHVAGRQAVGDVRQALIYMLGSYPKTFGGLRTQTTAVDTASPFSNPAPEPLAVSTDPIPEIIFDGRPYGLQLYGRSMIVRLFDARGLVQIANISDYGLNTLLEMAGIDPSERRIYIDRVRDYLDSDDLIRLSGAESRDYERVNRVPPTNARFWSGQQLRHVLGWDDLDIIWSSDEEQPMLVTCRIAGFNPNTAVPLAARLNVPGITEAGVRALLEERLERPVRNSRELRAMTGTATLLDPLQLSAFPSDCVVVELVFPDHELRYRFTLNLRQQNLEAPWEFNSYQRLPFRDADRTIEPTEDLVLPNA